MGNNFNQLPTLGVGMVYWPTLDPLLREANSLINVVEVEPQTIWHKIADIETPYIVDQDVWQHLQSLPQAKLVHSVGLPIGGASLPNPEQLKLFQNFTREVKAHWASEHLSFNQVSANGETWDTGFLLPPLQNANGLAAVVANIQQLQSYLDVPLLIETGVNYLQVQPDQWSDGEFVAAVATTADCGILLDLHNIWTNERNGRQSINEFLAQIPLERVSEVHLAGGEEYNGYWLDAHNGVVQPELMEIARQVLPQLPNLRALIFEVSPLLIEKVGLVDIRSQLIDIQELWQQRHTKVQNFVVPKPIIKRSVSEINPTDWTETLGKICTQQSLASSAPNFLGAMLADDPGMEVLQHLIGSARSGTVVTALPWTSELLFRKIGGSAYKKILQEFWQTSPPHMFGGDEAADFADYLACRDLDILYLSDILTYERARIESAYRRKEIVIDCEYDPIAIIEALAAGELPAKLEARSVTLRLPFLNHAEKVTH
jgi:uncharacterized protein